MKEHWQTLKASVAEIEKLRAGILDAGREGEIVERLSTELEEKHARLLETADPESDKDTKALVETGVQIQLIPARRKKADKRLVAAARLLPPVLERICGEARRAGEAESDLLTQKIVPLIRSYAPTVTEANGAKIDTALRIARGMPIHDCINQGALLSFNLWNWKNHLQEDAHYADDPPEQKERSSKNKQATIKDILNESTAFVARLNNIIKLGTFVHPDFGK